MIKDDKLIRLIARLDVKGHKLIKAIHLEGLRALGEPQEFAQKYYDQGADELIYIDLVASLYQRSVSPEIIRRAAEVIFVPMTVGGGVRNVDDVRTLLRAGADKIAVNTAAVYRPNLISEIAKEFGSQCMVLSIEAKEQNSGNWEVYTDNGREASGVDAVSWAKKGVELGAGEILVTSIDREGTTKGFDNQLIKEISNEVNVPVIASGGYGEKSHLKEVTDAGANAIAFADTLHFSKSTFSDLRSFASELNIKTRQV